MQHKCKQHNWSLPITNKIIIFTEYFQALHYPGTETSCLPCSTLSGMLCILQNCELSPVLKGVFPQTPAHCLLDVGASVMARLQIFSSASKFQVQCVSIHAGTWSCMENLMRRGKKTEIISGMQWMFQSNMLAFEIVIHSKYVTIGVWELCLTRQGGTLRVPNPSHLIRITGIWCSATQWSLQFNSCKYGTEQQI